MKEYLLKRREYAEKASLEYLYKYQVAEKNNDGIRHLFASDYAEWAGRLTEIDLMLEQLKD